MRDAAGFFRHLELIGFIPKTVIDVGVASGTEEIYSALPDAYYVLIEAVAEYEPALQKILQRLNGEYILTAVSDEQGEAQMMVQEPFYVSSLQYGDSVPDTAIRTVPVDRLDNIMGQRNLEGPVLLKTDCQGHDLQVIQGAGAQLPKIDMIICEMPVYGPWGGGAEFIDYVQGLDDLGFSFYDIWGCLYRPGDNRLQNLDLVFVHTDGKLRQNKLFTQGEHNLNLFGEAPKQTAPTQTPPSAKHGTIKTMLRKLLGR